jgi:hypothetical protein
MLKRYKIDADWRQYTLSTVCGGEDEVQDVGFDEQPLLLFKRLQELGKKPSFMLHISTAHYKGTPSCIPQHELDNFCYSGDSTPISNKQECKGHTVFETLAEYYRSMKRFLPNRAQAGIPTSETREKLAKLSSHQLFELTMDVSEEFYRRQEVSVTQENCAPSHLKVSPLLEIQEDPHERRNEARCTLHALEYHHLENIVYDVVRGVERRFPNLTATNLSPHGYSNRI